MDGDPVTRAIADAVDAVRTGDRSDRWVLDALARQQDRDSCKADRDRADTREQLRQEGYQ